MGILKKTGDNFGQDDSRTEPAQAADEASVLQRLVEHTPPSAGHNEHEDGWHRAIRLHGVTTLMARR
jgi:hypothetical protein